MSLHFLQTVTKWFGSQQEALAKAGITLCRAVRYQGVRDLTLPLANGLLSVLQTHLKPQKRLCALELLSRCQSIYPNLNVKLVLDLLESAMSWEQPEARGQAEALAAYMLESIMMDDEAFALANRIITGMAMAHARGNIDEVAAKKQKLIGLLKESTVRG